MHGSRILVVFLKIIDLIAKQGTMSVSPRGQQ